MIRIQKALRSLLRDLMCRWDWHDYPDGLDVNTPVHFYTYTCSHCGRKFEI